MHFLAGGVENHVTIIKFVEGGSAGEPLIQLAGDHCSIFSLKKEITMRLEWGTMSSSGLAML